MKIARAKLWDSIYLVAPWIKNIDDIEIPEALYKSCVDIVLIQDDIEFKTNYDKIVAVHYIKEALIELRKTGYMEFEL